MIHLINGRERGNRAVFGSGATWCGKKLVGTVPVIPPGDGTTTITCYGNEMRITDDPAKADCPHCRERFDAAYNAAFPEGLKPIATIRFDDPQAGDKLDALLKSAGLPPIVLFDAATGETRTLTIPETDQ